MPFSSSTFSNSDVTIVLKIRVGNLDYVSDRLLFHSVYHKRKQVMITITAR